MCSIFTNVEILIFHLNILDFAHFCSGDNKKCSLDKRKHLFLSVFCSPLKLGFAAPVGQICGFGCWYREVFLQVWVCLSDSVLKLRCHFSYHHMTLHPQLHLVLTKGFLLWVSLDSRHLCYI